MTTERVLTIEEIDWAYEVIGGGISVRTLCDLKADRDRYREALEQIEDERPALWIGILGMAYIDRTRKIARDALGRR